MPGEFQKKWRNLLEEEIEYATVTESRQRWLGLVEDLLAHPTKRYKITKRGKPAVVLISVALYDAYRVAAQRVLEQERSKDRRTALREASARFQKLLAQRGAGKRVAAPAAVEEAAAAESDDDLLLEH